MEVKLPVASSSAFGIIQRFSNIGRVGGGAADHHANSN